MHSVLLMTSKETALNYPKRDITLGFCQNCEFIFNTAFDPNLHEYSSQYEETQAFSATFNVFHKRLAAHLIERYDLHDKNIIEIGCGKGEFLTLLCELGGNLGVGFDPAYVYDRNQLSVKERVTFIKDFYSEKYAYYQGDFICCKMTLEHIKNTADFVGMIRRSIGDLFDTTVFFQVPDATRILQDLAFWDIYYEHCSYFSPESLSRLFERCGFSVIDLWKDYGEQYIMIEAKPAKQHYVTSSLQKNGISEMQHKLTYFVNNCQGKIDEWKLKIRRIREGGKRVLVWGAGSKAVSFLTKLDIHDEINYAVDVNPYKHGTYMVGTGQEIVSPDFLRDYQPDVVIVMNPIYREEIKSDLDKMALTPSILIV